MPDLVVDLTRRELPPDLGRLVAEARRLIGWSQRELAGRADTSQSTVSRIERGAATALDLAVVARSSTHSACVPSSTSMGATSRTGVARSMASTHG